MIENELLYTTIGQNLSETIQSQMFGKPCFKINGKAFVCFFQDQMVFKLTGEEHKSALSLDGAQLFDPSGKSRPMKEWIQVPYSYHERWTGFAKSALEYVNSK
jgi:hypothetical protein